MKRAIFAVILLVTVLTLNTSAVEYKVSFNQMYLYSHDVYKNSPNLNGLYNDTQTRINKSIYGQAAVVFSEDHFNLCYGDVNTDIFNSFKKNVTPLLPMAFSVVEWGGNGDLKYSFTPAIATRKLRENGVPLSAIDPTTVDSNYYESMGVDFNDKSYWGPLQINRNYMTPTHDKGYRCGYIPTDYYSWPDACQWTFHDKCEQIKNCWNKDYVFKNEYAVVAHTSIAHNSGGSHLSTKDFYLDRDWYPWKSSQAVFDYVDFITSDTNLQIILDDADSYAVNLIDSYSRGEESGSLYKSISSCRDLSKQIGIDWNNYVKGNWLGNMEYGNMSGSGLRNWEKTMYPIQSIWSYRVLQNLYNKK